MANIGLLMVDEGLLSADDLMRAMARKDREGGSLALSLVLEHAVNQFALMEFYEKRLGYTRVPESVLNQLDAATFALVPLEIVYESGLLPLYLEGESRLAVGLVDPTDQGLMAEATFFSGYTLVAQLITVTQMARHFHRISKQPWRVGPHQAEMIEEDSSRVAGTSLNSAVENLLEQTSALDRHLEHSLEASLADAFADTNGFVPTGAQSHREVVGFGEFDDLTPPARDIVPAHHLPPRPLPPEPLAGVESFGHPPRPHQFADRPPTPQTLPARPTRRPVATRPAIVTQPISAQPSSSFPAEPPPTTAMKPLADAAQAELNRVLADPHFSETQHDPVFAGNDLGLAGVEMFPSDSEQQDNRSVWFHSKLAAEVEEIRLETADQRNVVIDQSTIRGATIEMPALAQRTERPVRTHVTADQVVQINVSDVIARELGLDGFVEKPKEPIAEPVVRGEAKTSSGNYDVYGFNMNRTAPQALVEPPKEPTQPIPIVTPAPFSERPRTKIPSQPKGTTGFGQQTLKFHHLTRFQAQLGPADPQAAGAVTALSAQLALVREREQLGNVTVNGLSLLYRRVALFTLNGPHAVVWRVLIDGAPDRATEGVKIPLNEGGILHRVSDAGVFYTGTVPSNSALVATLKPRPGDQVLVVPIQLRDRTILVLYLEADGILRSPGEHMERLLVDLGHTLERVILLRKRGRRQ